MKPRPRRLAGALAAVIAGAALGATPALAGGLLGISIGGGSSPVGVTVGGSGSPIGVTVGGSGSGSSSAPAVGISVLSGSSEEGTSLLKVSKGEETVAEVKAPTVPTVETPKTPTGGSTTPTTGETPVASGGGEARSPTLTHGEAVTTSSSGVGAATPGDSVAASSTHRAATTRSASGHTKGRVRHAHAGAVVVVPTAATRTPAAAGGGDPSTLRRASHTGSDPLSSIGRSLPLPLPVPDWSKPIILALVLLAAVLWFRSIRATRRASRLERSQSRLLADLDAMQAALVPAVPATVEGLGVSVAYRPAEGPAAGGDFYDVFALGPGRVAAILGDVAGHGHDALEQAALTRYTLRAYLQATGEPRTTLALAGQALADPECAQLATVAVAVYDRNQGTLTYALAGHPPPILTGVPAVESPAVCSSPPLGWNVPTGRRQRTISLGRGARVCLFSDGLIEARCADPGGGAPGLLGRERLRALLEELPDEAGAVELLSAIRAEADATPDDMAACVLAPSVAAPQPGIDIEEIEIDERPLRGGQLHALLQALGLEPAALERLLGQTRFALERQETVLLRIDRSDRLVQVALGETGPEAPAVEAGTAALLRA